jgi:hypothetical protein
VLLLAGTACAQGYKELPTPDHRRPVSLRVLVVNSARFGAIDEKLTNEVLAQTRRMAHENFSVDLRFEAPEFRAAEYLGSMLDANQVRRIHAQRLDPLTNQGSRDLQELLQRDLAINGGSLVGLANFAAPYLLERPKDESEAGLARALVSTQASLFRRWKSQVAADGWPMINPDDLLHEYATWIVLGETPLDFELVLTNIPIVSAQRLVNSVHSALRGGAANGNTGPAKATSTGAYSVVSVFPAISRDVVTTELRDVRRPSRAQSVRYVAAVVTHELGHQLLHLGHPFDNKSCIMRPPVRFRFEEWLNGLSASACEIGSEPAMTPGVSIHLPDIRGVRVQLF